MASEQLGQTLPQRRERERARQQQALPGLQEDGGRSSGWIYTAALRSLHMANMTTAALRS